MSLMVAAAIGGGCKKKAADTEAQRQSGTAKTSIQNSGSDTMVNLAQAWAEEYAKVEPHVSIEVSGGGSGLGIAALINGTTDIANTSRRLEDDERAKAKAASGKEPQEFTVGYDALSIYVHKDNPINEISLEELAEMFKAGGNITKWSQVGIKSIPGAKGDELVLVSRQNNSGTYYYFHEVVIGKKSDFRQGTLDMNGSKDVVELIGKTPNAIGYSGHGYATPAVKTLKVSAKKGQAGVEPSIASVQDKSYPIARPMFMYTPGDPTPEVRKFLDWVLSDAGQKIVETTGYVPLTKK